MVTMPRLSRDSVILMDGLEIEVEATTKSTAGLRYFTSPGINIKQKIRVVFYLVSHQ